MNTIRSATVLLFILILVVMGALFTYRTVQPGFMGVRISLGQAEPTPLGPGFYFVMPAVSRIEPVNVQTQSVNFRAACFSSDLQTLQMNVTVIFRNKTDQVVTLFTKFQGDVLDSLLVPSTQESLKQVTALKTAEAIVQEREHIKTQALEILRKKMEAYDVCTIDDLVLVNIDLSNQLEAAIEAKMVQQQKAAQAVFSQEQVKVEAATAVIRAEGEAKALEIRGKAIRETPEIIYLNMAEKWDGRAPSTLVLGNGTQGISLLLPGNTTTK